MHPPYPPRPHHPAPQPPHAPGQPTLQIGGAHGIQVYGHGAQQEVRMGGVTQARPQYSQPGPYPQHAQLPPAIGNGPGALAPGSADKVQSFSAALDEELYQNPKRLTSLLFLGAVALSVLGGLFLTPMLAAPMVFVVGCFTAAAACLGGRAVVASRARALEAGGSLPLPLELSLLELAHERGGVLTVAQSARELKISLNDAEKALSRLAKRGHAEMDVNPHGEIRYRLGPSPAAAPPSLPAAGPRV